MSLITIPKEELEQLEAAIKKRDLLIAGHERTIEIQKFALDIQEGLLTYNFLLSQQVQLLYWRVVKEMEAITPHPVVIQGKYDSTVKMIEDLEGKVLAGKEAWVKFLLEHDKAKSFLIGQRNFTIPDMPVVQ